MQKHNTSIQKQNKTGTESDDGRRQDAGDRGDRTQKTESDDCCDWLQETIKYEPVDPSELAKLKYKC